MWRGRVGALTVGARNRCGRILASKDIDYSGLAEWCKTRKGQVIVCEQLGADWLPFRELTKIKGLKNKSTEVIWTNYPMILQYRLFPL